MQVLQLRFASFRMTVFDRASFAYDGRTACLAVSLRMNFDHTSFIQDVQRFRALRG